MGPWATLSDMSDVPPAADDIVEGIRKLLHEAADTHHIVYRIVDGDDPDWASWYAKWLITLSELPDLLRTKPVRSDLVCALVGLDREYTATSPPEPWEAFYAPRLLEHFSPAAR